MAQRRCPCCGAPYNGKRCRQCYYETFTEEIAHGNHTHEGEPLVISAPEARKSPRPSLERSEDCRRFTGRRKTGSSFRVLAVLFFIIAAVMLLRAVFFMATDMDIVIRDETVAIDADRLAVGLVLYDADGVQVVLDWQSGQSFENPMQVWLINDSDWRVNAYPEQVYANGYLLESAFFYCSADPGESDTSYLWIDEDELESLGIYQIQQLRLRTGVYDNDTFDTLGSGELMELTYPVSSDFIQEIDDAGQVLWDQDGIRIIFRGIVGSNDCQDAKLELFVENNSDVYTEISFGDTLVNGEAMSIYCFCALAPGTRAVTTAGLWLLPGYDITQVEQIRTLEVVLEMKGEGGWQDAVVTDPIALNLK